MTETGNNNEIISSLHYWCGSSSLRIKTFQNLLLNTVNTLLHIEDENTSNKKQIPSPSTPS